MISYRYRILTTIMESARCASVSDYDVRRRVRRKRADDVTKFVTDYFIITVSHSFVHKLTSTHTNRKTKIIFWLS